MFKKKKKVKPGEGKIIDGSLVYNNINQIEQENIDVDHDSLCPVCICIMVEPAKLPACGHLFCIQCIRQVQKRGAKKCPMCRTLMFFGYAG